MSEHLRLITNHINPAEWSFRATMFAHEKDNEPQHCIGTLGELFGEAHEVRETKKGTRVFSPCRYKEGTRRSKKNVEAITAIGMDLDKLKGVDLDAIWSRLSRWAYVSYTTFSHQERGADDNRYRVLIPISAEISTRDYGRIWEVVNRKLFDGKADKAARDASRIFFLPSCPPDRAALASITYHCGELVDPAMFLLDVGNRNNHLMSLAGSLRRKGASEETILAAIRKENERALDEEGRPAPLEDDELSKVASSAANYASEELGMVEVPRNEKGKAVYYTDVLAKILREDVKYAGRLTWNTLHDECELDGKRMEDIDYTELRIDVTERYRFKVPKDEFYDVVDSIAAKNRVNPVVDYLEGLTWDGVPRIERAVTEILKADLSMGEVQKVYLKKWMISAVARALDPGCKVDTVLLLKGDQGLAKSTFFHDIAGGTDFFKDTSPRVGEKDGMSALKGVWIYEWAELDSLFRKKDVAAIKAFLTSRVDDYRKSYGRKEVKQHRMCVIVGSTNEYEFLYDATGSRRFWVIECLAELDLALLAQWRDQLWAEAKHLYETGVKWWLTKEEEAAQSEMNENYTEECSVLDHKVREVVGKLESKEGFTGEIAAVALWNGLLVGDENHRQKKAVGSAMRRLGYKPAVLKDIDRRSYRAWTK